MAKGREVRVAGVILLATVSLLASCGKTSTIPPPTPPPSSLGPVTIFPGSASVPVTQQVQLTAFLSSAPTAKFTWSLSGGSANGTIDANTGIYTAPASVPSSASVTITATDSASSGTTGTATLTITAAQAIVVGLVDTTSPTGTPGPSVVPLAAGVTQAFSASSGGTHISPTWEVNGTAGGDVEHGTISADENGNGVYVAPLSPPPGGSTVITAVNGGNSGTATVTIVYSNASLNGPYAFSYSGNDGSGPMGVAGSFTANAGAGTLSGVEDYNSASLKAPAQGVAFTGTYSINPDGSGTAMVSDPAAGGSDTWSLALTSAATGGVAQHALLVRFDTKATGSGALDAQTPSALQLSSITGNYAFVLAGFDTKSLPLDVVGKFRADGLGNLPPNFAEEDYNDGGTTTSGAVDTTLDGSFFLDATFPGSGRGLLTLTNTSAQIPGTYNFTFYMVDGTHLKVVENDLNAFLTGDIYSAPNTNGSFVATGVSGNFPFALGGETAGGGSAFAEGGIMVSTGTGTLTGPLDENNGGSTLLNQSLNGSYTVDQNFGRITFTFAIPGKSRTLAGYATSSGDIAMIDLDTDAVTSGLAIHQAGTSPLEGGYAMNFAGKPGKKSFTEEDMIGQLELNASLESVTGTMNIDSAGTVSSGVGVTTPSTTNSTTPISSADVNGRGTITLTTQSATFTAVYYLASPDVALTLGTDSSRVSVGTFLKKF
jgi:hypothetical protein